MAESLTLRTLRQLLEDWKKDSACEWPLDYYHEGKRDATALCADELAATLTAMRCETCKHLAPFVVSRVHLAGECNHPELGGNEVRKDHFCKEHEVALVAPRADSDREE